MEINLLYVHGVKSCQDERQNAQSSFTDLEQAVNADLPGRIASYQAAHPGTTVVTHVKASLKAGSTPGLVQFNATGRNGGYAVAPAAIPVRVTVALDSAAGQCGEAPFAGPPPSPSCTLGTSALSCKWA